MTKAQSDKGTEAQRHKGTEAQSDKGTEAQRHKVTKAQRHRGMKTYKDLIVWQKSMDLVTEIYKITKTFPQEEKYGLISQIRRSAVSVPSNIAEVLLTIIFVFYKYLSVPFMRCKLK